MSVEEKRIFVQAYCQQVGCAGCVLSVSWCNKNAYACCDESALDEALSLMGVSDFEIGGAEDGQA